MQVATIDFETYWSQEHSVSKMSPMAYATHPDTELISVAIKIDQHPTDVFFGEANIKKVLGKLDWSTKMIVGHNMSAFDAMFLRWRLGINPKLWGCTLAMARPLHAKTVGLSLGKLVAHYQLGVKDNSALMNTKGRHLKDFSEAEIDAMRDYNRADTDQCYALFNVLKQHYSAKELWQIDATIRMLVDAQLEVNTSMLEVAASMERDQKRKSILELARHLRKSDIASAEVMSAETVEELEEAVRTELASSPKFSALLESLGVETPMKPSPSNPEKQVPALAKTDDAFTAMQEHDNPLVAAAARARLAVKSTILETRIQAFLDVAENTNGKFPFPLHYCGADTSGRWSGWAYNPQNLPRVGKAPKVSDALRNCLKAPKGHMIVVADLSGIELRVNHYLWKVRESMSLYARDAEADLYKAFAAARYGVTPEEVTKDQRQLAKVAQLGLGFGAGWSTFMKVAKTMGGLVLDEDESRGIVDAWRTQYAEITQGWRTCHARLVDIHVGAESQIDPWGLCITCAEGIRLPSGRIIRYPELRKERGPDGRDEWWYATGRHKARIYAGKIDENCVQALARDVIADDALEVFRRTKLRPVGMVHDELIYVVPEGEAQGVLDEVQKVMRTPPKWWPQLVTWSEGDIAQTYGAAK